MLFPDPPDITAVLERGRVAAALLEQEAFVAVVNDLSNYHVAALVAAPPGASGTEAREYHHLMQHALTEIVAALRQHADTAAELREKLEQLNLEDDDGRD